MSGLAWVLGNMWDADLRRRVFRWRSHAYWQHSRTNWAYLQLLFEKRSSLFFNKTCVRSSLWSMKRHIRSSDLYAQFRWTLYKSIARSACQLLNTLQTFSDTTSVLKTKSWNSYYNNGIIGLYNITDRTKQGSVFCPIFDRTAVICIQRNTVKRDHNLPPLNFIWK